MAATAAAAALDGSARRRTAYARTELETLRGAPSEEAQARLWTEVRAALIAAGCSSEYDGLLVAEDEEPRSGRGSKGRQRAGEALGPGGSGVKRRRRPHFLVRLF
jgi:survival of motor neuron protein-interacting protein 1